MASAQTRAYWLKRLLIPELFTVVTPDEALETLRTHASHRVESEDVKTNLAYGRVTAADIHVPSALPAFPRSTMDGYAVIAADTYGAKAGIRRTSPRY